MLTGMSADTLVSFGRLVNCLSYSPSKGAVPENEARANIMSQQVNTTVTVNAALNMAALAGRWPAIDVNWNDGDYFG